MSRPSTVPVTEISPEEFITTLSLPSTLNFIALEPTALSSSTSIRSCVLSRVISPLLLVSESSNLILGLFCVTPILEVKEGEIFDPAIAALAFISALTIVPFAIFAEVTTPLSIVKVDPEPETVISPLSPSSIPPATFAIDPSSFFKNISPVSVLMAGSPKTRSLALGSLPEPCFNLIVFAIESPP